jgi:two-component system, LuxR family, response regulator FixJ
MTSKSDRHPTVFIVDDEPVIRDCVSLLVQTMGLSTKCFSSAVDFLDFIVPIEISHPVCLIADVQMPQINGIQLLKQLSALGKQFSVIMTSGHNTTTLKQQALDLGATAFLEKPFQPGELKETIATSLKRETGNTNMA